MRVRAMVGWTVTCALFGLLVGCGGSTNHNAHDGAAGSSNVASGGSSSGGALNGSSGAGATAAAEAGGAPPDRPLDSFESSSRMASLGLWMGFPGPGDSLPIGTPAVPHDGTALHLVGMTDDTGLDVFFHTGAPFETIFRGVRFWVQSDNAGSQVTVAVAGPEPSYFTDRAQGLLWPEQVITLTREWKEVVIDFEEWGIGPRHLSPHSEMWGAFHFIIEPNTAYDLWIDDFVGQSLYY